jgi:hypothetical protein
MATYTANQLIAIAKNEIGYLEKRSNANLDGKTANAGSNNYTKYSRDLLNWVGGPYANGVAWCDIFVDWCFYMAFGKNVAKKLLGGWSAYTPTSAQYFKSMGRYYKTNPKAGDVIFFHNNTVICHTGIVTKVEGSYVYTIEGNTSNGSTVIPNGGAVCEKRYSLSYSRIDGYGRPAYSDETTSTFKPIVSPAKAYGGTFPKIPPIIKNGSKGTQVINLQRYLNWFGTYSLVVDGIAGKYTVNAIKDFQKRTGLTVDGEFGPKSLAMAKVIKK